MCAYNVPDRVYAEARMPRCTPLARGRFASTPDSAPPRSPTRSTDEISLLVSLPMIQPTAVTCGRFSRAGSLQSY